MKITNTQQGPRGVNAVSGPVLVEPGQTVEVEVYAREKEHIEATQWFEIDGSYKSDPKADGEKVETKKSAKADDSAEVAALKAQLADRDKEIAKLKEPKKDKPASDAPKTAAEVLELSTGNFLAFKAEAAKLLGDKTPSKKDEIVAALEELATQP